MQANLVSYQISSRQLTRPQSHLQLRWPLLQKAAGEYEHVRYLHAALTTLLVRMHAVRGSNWNAAQQHRLSLVYSFSQ